MSTKVPSIDIILFNQDLLFDVFKCITDFSLIIKISLPMGGAIDMLGFKLSKSKNLTTMGSSFKRNVWISIKRGVASSLVMVLDTVP